MSATGFHPEPSAKAPWTRTIVLTAAYAGGDAARAAPVRRARIMRFMVYLRYKRPLEDPVLADTLSRGLQTAAPAMRHQILVVSASTKGDLERAFTTLVERRVGGLVVGNDPFFNARPVRSSRPRSRVPPPP